MMRNYKKVVAWQRADQLTLEVYRATRGFPKDEVYGLTAQVRRAAYSVPSNIAEGAGRETDSEYLRFLHIARGSLSETEYFLHLAHNLNYLADDEYEKLTTLVNQTFAALHGLIRSISQSRS
jgi:four helix bundle protein